MPIHWNAVIIAESSGSELTGARVKHYRINKVEKPGGAVLKKKDVLAASDAEALQRAKEIEDCPVCEVLRDGHPVGTIL